MDEQEKMQTGITKSMMDMFSISVQGFYLGTPDGRHELAAIARHIADLIDNEKSTLNDGVSIMKELAAYNQAKIVLLQSADGK